jgi:transcriptional regulator with XRE-family HTH domain
MIVSRNPSDTRYRDESWLRQKYVDKGLTQKEISNMCGVGKRTISEWCNKFDIDTGNSGRRSVEDERYKNEEWLREKYVEEKMSNREIGELCGVEETTIRQFRNKFGIDGRSIKEATRLALGEYVPYFTNKRQTENNSLGHEMWSDAISGKKLYVHQLLAIADGADPNKVFSNGEYQVHHINNIPWDNRSENIELLTASEHSTHSSNQRWGNYDYE